METSGGSEDLVAGKLAEQVCWPGVVWSGSRGRVSSRGRVPVFVVDLHAYPFHLPLKWDHQSVLPSQHVGVPCIGPGDFGDGSWIQSSAAFLLPLGRTWEER